MNLTQKKCINRTKKKQNSSFWYCYFGKKTNFFFLKIKKTEKNIFFALKIIAKHLECKVNYLNILKLWKKQKMLVFVENQLNWAEHDFQLFLFISLEKWPTNMILLLRKINLFFKKNNQLTCKLQFWNLIGFCLFFSFCWASDKLSPGGGGLEMNLFFENKF